MAIPFAFPSDEDTDEDYQRLDQLLSDLFNVLQQISQTQRRIRNAQQPQQIVTRIRNGPSTNYRRSGGDDSSSSSPSTSSSSPSSSSSEPSRLFIAPDDHHITADLSWSTELQTASTSSSTSTNIVPTTEHLQRFDTTMTHTRSPTRRRRRRRRTTSESSCCDETKPSNLTATEVTTSMAPATVSQDWTQVGVNLRKIADDFYASVGKAESQTNESKRPCGVNANTSDASLLSMLVPPPFSGSIWTAVIFVVGWRLLARAR